MRVGLATPAVTAHPAAASRWEHDAGIAEIARVVRAADALGYHHATCSEHVAIPAAAAAERGGTYWDPLATFGHLSALTRRIRLATHVVVLGYHHPLEIAKRYGTLDRVSNGRLVLGVGVGSLAEEFSLLGADFTDRGARADDALAAVRSAFGTPTPTHRGPYYAYDGVVVQPHSAGPVPVWVGGRTRRALRRAVELGDGFCPFALSARQVGELLSCVSTPPEFDVVLGVGPVDPLGDPDTAVRRLARVRDVGATVASVTVGSRDAAHHVDQLARLRELAIGEGATFGDIEETR
ncbi:TIGR03619 family F420-dependent LLM class oxidoreductase [Gordonia shandongensis]|uniref:TIGR03619 family F420-dependent LLM class oxidoreductase n=1 Tax=Gordonia shandongensis TaxID=376351 RepID=UPI00047D1BD5|nr:TIGR03619 family F420-dependent LLM class oxidoreductase [Gordonia shandongensis]